MEEEELFGFGELEVEVGTSRLGREEDVGVMMAWEELVRRKGPGGSRGEAMVDMAVVIGGRSSICCVYPLSDARVYRMVLLAVMLKLNLLCC